MRKDFLVDPYQVLEARAAGAGGVLVILRMLTPERIADLLDAAADHRLFVLLEAFDGADLDLARQLLASRALHQTILIGINSRDLQTLKVVQQRFAELAPLLPEQSACVAESGVATPSDAHAMRHLGYRLALIGTALMSCDDPAVLLEEILTSADAIAAAAEAKVDAIGFVFAPSPRQVTPGQAAQLAALAPPGILRIAVAQHPLQMKVDEICRILKPDYFQTDVEDLRELKIPSHVKVLPVVRFGRKTPSPLPARMLFEGPSSGIGELADWGRAAELARQTEVILAGGLSAQNVGEAIQAVRPFGVDVSSGVEDVPGVKDPEKIYEFVRAARAAATRMEHDA
jgi:phosphoribosylanthranilate isomerase